MNKIETLRTSLIISVAGLMVAACGGGPENGRADCTLTFTNAYQPEKTIKLTIADGDTFRIVQTGDGEETAHWDQECKDGRVVSASTRGPDQVFTVNKRGQLVSK